MREVVIVADCRTAIGSFQGSLSAIPATELGAVMIREMLSRTGVEGGQVDEVLIGQVLTAGAGQNPARQAVLKAGLSHTVPAMTLNKVCGSGLKAVILGARRFAVATPRWLLPVARVWRWWSSVEHGCTGLSRLGVVGVVRRHPAREAQSGPRDCS